MARRNGKAQSWRTAPDIHMGCDGKSGSQEMFPPCSIYTEQVLVMQMQLLQILNSKLDCSFSFGWVCTLGGPAEHPEVTKAFRRRLQSCTVLEMENPSRSHLALLG